MLCYVMLYNVMLCAVLVRCAMLCYIMLCYTSYYCAPRLPPLRLRAHRLPSHLRYTQFAIQDSGLFGPNPWNLFAQIVNVLP